MAIAVVLKRVPLGSLREGFLVPGRKFVPWRNWGGKAVNEKTRNFYYLFINTQRDWFQRQAALNYSD